MNAGLALKAPAAAGSCPRCQKPMIDPQGLGWCKACGYCRSLEDSQKTVAPTPAAAPATPKLTASAVVGQTPVWFWVALLGSLVIAGATFAGAYYLTLKPLERALLTTAQMAAGLALMFTAQLIALIQIAPEDASLSFKDAIIPFRLYGLMMKRLPRTRRAVYLATWGLAAIITANLFIGGLGHWLTYMPGKNKNHATTKKATR